MPCSKGAARLHAKHAEPQRPCHKTLFAQRPCLPNSDPLADVQLVHTKLLASLLTAAEHDVRAFHLILRIVLYLLPCIICPPLESICHRQLSFRHSLPMHEPPCQTHSSSMACPSSFFHTSLPVAHDPEPTLQRFFG